jgi:flagellar hook-associated protein 2
MATTSSATSTVSSSLDVNAIVTGLMSIERQPINTLNTKVTSTQAKISALGLIKNQVSNFQTAVQALGSAGSSSFNVFKANTSDSSIFTAAADSTAVAGSYSLAVTSLAQSQNLVTAGSVSSTAAISNGVATTISFDFGTISGGTLANGSYTGAGFASNGAAVQSITIDSTNNTLTGIRDAINTAKMGVTATLVNDGSGTPFRLALSVDNSGANNSLKITTSGGDGTLNSLLANDPAGVQHLNQTIAAQNANFSVNGIAISKASNTVTDAIQGVTLNLKSLTTTPATLTLGRDTTAVSTAINGFVTAYNALYGAMKNSSAYKSGSALEGDATLRSLQSQMRSIASGPGNSGAVFNTLADIGITFTADGTMQADSGGLNTKLSSNYADVASLFNSASGYATQFETFTKSTLAFDGALSNRTTGLNTTVKNINDQISKLEVRMTTIEKRYRSQYSSLSVLLTNMNQTSTYLAQQLPRL